ncbi:MAG: BspA family leucine-rich repeat surface protein [Bacteroidaceae bacterium]|nr:BspA family leucine-rich repeat surface protein [Bacteroidaceae bacterium]
MRQKKSWEDICVSPKFFIYLWHLSVWFMNLDIAFIEGLEYINTSYVTSMNKLFYGCSKLTQLDDFWKLKTDLVVSMSNMFYGCHSLASIELKATNTANVTNMSNMFYECTSLVNLDLSNVNTSKVANMNGMFYGCEKLNNVYMDPKTFDTSNVTTMKRMFYKCKKLPYVNLTRFDTRNVTDMSAMFQECPIMSHLDLSSFNTANVAAMNNMFYGCSGLEKIYVSDEWSNENVTSSIGMFRGCTSLVGGEGTTYNTNHTDGGYAHVDGGIDNPGYFIYRESTGLESPSAQRNAGDGWYTLSGIRLKEEPTQRGVYIHDGRKVVK